jgi:hypothetical protein
MSVRHSALCAEVNATRERRHMKRALLKQALLKQALCAVAIIAATAGSSTSAHHSYAVYDTTRLVEVEGIIEEFEWIAPHSLLRVRTDEARLYTAEWRPPIGLERVGIERDTLKKGDRIVITGNPRRDFDESGIVNFKSVRRLADGWEWPARTDTRHP